MTEEEKKAIWWLEEIVIDKEEYIKYHAWVGTKTLDNIEVLLNLIKKQDKRINESEKEKEKKDRIINKLVANAILEIYDFDTNKTYKGQEVIEYFERKEE